MVVAVVAWENVPIIWERPQCQSGLVPEGMGAPNCPFGLTGPSGSAHSADAKFSKLGDLRGEDGEFVFKQGYSPTCTQQGRHRGKGLQFSLFKAAAAATFLSIDCRRLL